MIEKFAEAKLPTRFGKYTIIAFTGKGEHIALVRGNVKGAAGVCVRLHSQCLTGDTFGSLRCDCRDQLEASLRCLAGKRKGVLLYMAQEGRGIGLSNKIKAYALQEQGMDTVEANEHLGFKSDERDFSVASEMLKQLGVKSIVLMTNNPEKVESLRKHGVNVIRRCPLKTVPNKYNRKYINTKKEKMHHIL